MWVEKLDAPINISVPEVRPVPEGVCGWHGTPGLGLRPLHLAWVCHGLYARPRGRAYGTRGKMGWVASFCYKHITPSEWVPEAITVQKMNYNAHLVHPANHKNPVQKHEIRIMSNENKGAFSGGNRSFWGRREKHLARVCYGLYARPRGRACGARGEIYSG
ncbi:hypothetical protein CYPRO_0911 [Cyclonatronum proteinivorum]|uniref:Uncharacterized protein n=1 Tax=Cyclonatronum proteinivorum TaxID=1457365 RepID=A0A345UI86_9BACT|nr:hypothetical protein CYPRO_0911 [Cyclonatronum proteinivorum]